MSTKKIYFYDYKLIDGKRIIKGNKTEIVLKSFAVNQIQKIKAILMHIALTEQQADTFVDCVIDDHFAFNGDMKEFEDKLECIGHFLDYYLDRLPKSVQITDETEPEKEKSNKNKFSLYDDEDLPF